MPFLILGYDGEDEQALERRLAVREAHIKLGDQLRDAGKVLYGVAMLNDRAEMIGSVYIMNMDTREEVDEWLKTEPYMTGNVWQKVEVTPCAVGPSFVNII
ncbi:MAG: hypothetical protein KDD62_14530 [Bdellovibrionales bacterium]|nr:hypothetical protein [Bdellovibrionales bacterium]